MKVTVYGPLRDVTSEKTVTVTFDGGTVADALAVFVENYPRAKSSLYANEGELRPSVRLSVDGERVDLDDACPPAAELTVFPAVQGGTYRRKRSDREDGHP